MSGISRSSVAASMRVDSGRAPGVAPCAYLNWSASLPWLLLLWKSSSIPSCKMYSAIIGEAEAALPHPWTGWLLWLYLPGSLSQSLKLFCHIRRGRRGVDNTGDATQMKTGKSSSLSVRWTVTQLGSSTCQGPVTIIMHSVWVACILWSVDSEKVN